MLFAAFCVVQLLSLASGESGAASELSLVFLRGECEVNPSQPEHSLEENAARIAAEDVAVCSGVNLPVRLTSAAAEDSSAANRELDALLEVVQPALFNSSLQIIGVVYTGCSEGVRVLAEVLSSRTYQIPLLSFRFLPSPHHSTGNSYYHTRIVPDKAALTPAVVTVITQFSWTRVALLSENTPAFKELHNDMLGELDESGVSVHHQLILDSAPKLLPPDTRTLFGEDVKVSVLNMSPLLAKAVLCRALRDLTYPGYVWITYGWYGEQWWEEGEGDSVSCTTQQLAVYLERSLVISHYPTWTVGEGSGAVTNQPTCLKSGPELTNELLLRTAPPTTPPPGLRSPLPSSVYLVYDAVWTAALAHTTAPLSRYPETVDKVFFEGSSGLVSFGNGTRELFHLTLFQYRRVNGELQRVTVASLTPLEDRSCYDITFNEGETPATVWPNGVPPDGTPIQVEHFPYPALMGIVYTYSLLGVLFALGCLTFNLVFRNRKLIRLTSPNLNNIIVLGAIICYLAGLTFFYPQGASRTGIIWGCNLRAWTAALGFSACYGTLNVKMWRVYSICRNPRPSMSKTLIKDYHLMLLILGFVMVDTIALVVVMSLDNSRFTVVTIPNKQDPTPRINEEGIKEVSVVSRCLSTTEPYWLSILFGYKAIIQAIGLYLAFKIRNIKIRGLNDSREVSITLYISSVILLVVVVVTFVYGDYIDVDGFVYGVGLSTAATVVLSLTFITKMVNLYRDPEGKNIFQAPTSTGADPGTDIHYLQRRVRELEKQVELARSQENLLDIGTTPKSLSIAPPPVSSSANTSPSTVTTSRAQAPSE